MWQKIHVTFLYHIIKWNMRILGHQFQSMDLLTERTCILALDNMMIPLFKICVTQKHQKQHDSQ